MSEEVELPPLFVTETDRNRAKTDCCEHFRALGPRILCCERQLREALAQIAALTEQVDGRERYIQFIREGLHALEDRCGIKSKDEPGDATVAISEAVHSLKDELALLKSDAAALQSSTDKRAAELAALREGAMVTYRVEFQWGHSKAWEEVPAHVGDCCHATLVGAENHMNSLKPNNTLRIVEIITRERVLDATGGEG